MEHHNEPATETGLCFFGDQQIDRSPTGSGIAARVALAYAKGERKWARDGFSIVWFLVLLVRASLLESLLNRLNSPLALEKTSMLSLLGSKDMHTTLASALSWWKMMILSQKDSCSTNYQKGGVKAKSGRCEHNSSCQSNEEQNGHTPIVDLFPKR